MLDILVLMNVNGQMNSQKKRHTEKEIENEERRNSHSSTQECQASLSIKPTRNLFQVPANRQI